MAARGRHLSACHASLDSLEASVADDTDEQGSAEFAFSSLLLPKRLKPLICPTLSTDQKARSSNLFGRATFSMTC
jgi:hypothetical protein